MEEVIKMLEDKKQLLEKYDKKSINPLLNMWRKYRKRKMINTYCLQVIKDNNESATYKSIKDIAILYHHLPKYDYEYNPFYGEHFKNANYNYGVNRVIIGNDYIELKLRLYSQDEDKPDRLSLEYTFIFRESGDVEMTKITHSDNGSIATSRTVREPIYKGVLEFEILYYTVIEYVTTQVYLYLAM